MAAVNDNSALVILLLEAMTNLDKQTQQCILCKKPQSGLWNALMTAVFYQPDFVPDLLEFIETLEESKKREILQIDFNANWNYIIRLACHDVITIPDLLNVICELEVSPKETIVKELNYKDWDSLKEAACKDLIHYDELLYAFKKLNASQQKRILEKVGCDNWNDLRKAMTNNYLFIIKLLISISGLKEKKKKIILKNILKYGWDGLMIAAGYDPELVHDFFEYTDNLDTKQQAEILKRISIDDMNVFMIAAWYNSESVSYLCKVIAKLKVSQQAKILQQRDVEDDNVLDLAAYEGSTVKCKVLNVIANLDALQQKEMFKKLTYKDWDNLLFMIEPPPRVFRLILEVTANLSESKNKVIEAVNEGVYVIVRRALRDNPETVPELLKVMVGLDKKRRLDILNRFDFIDLWKLNNAVHKHSKNDDKETILGLFEPVVRLKNTTSKNATLYNHSLNLFSPVKTKNNEPIVDKLESLIEQCRSSSSSSSSALNSEQLNTLKFYVIKNDIGNLKKHVSSIKKNYGNKELPKILEEINEYLNDKDSRLPSSNTLISNSHRSNKRKRENDNLSFENQSTVKHKVNSIFINNNTSKEKPLTNIDNAFKLLSFKK